MKLIDDLKTLFNTKNQRIADQFRIITDQANRLEVLEVKMNQQDDDFITLAEHHDKDMVDYGKLEADVRYYKGKFEEEYTYRQRLIENGHTVDPETKMCALSEKLRVILFDVVRMYVELEKEAANESRTTD
jgi:hypothetical protein